MFKNDMKSVLYILPSRNGFFYFNKIHRYELHSWLTAGLKLMFVSFVLLTLTFICGCMNVAGDVAAHDMMFIGSPNLSEVLISAPQLGDGYARVIFYCHRQSVLAFALQISNNPVVTINGDNGFLRKEIMDQTGFYIDVPAGVYEIEEKSGRTLREEFKAPNEYFVKLFNSQDNPPILVEPQQAQQEIYENKIKYPHLIMKCEHNVKLALIPKESVQSENTAFNIVDNPISKDKSYLYFFNTKSGWVAPNIKFKVGVDCKPTFDVENKSYICFEVAPGRHVLCTSVINFGKEAFSPIGVEFWAENGNNVYVCYDWDKTRFRVLNEEEGAKLLKQYKATKNGYYKVMN
jgi:hypothetical protein